MSNISNFNNTSHYVPILNSILVSELIILILIHVGFFKTKFLRSWYNKFGLSAVLMDVLILMIGFILTRFFYNLVFKDFSILKFTILFLIIQVIHDFCFYLFFEYIVPRNANKVIDLFKNYAKEVGVGAILGDSFMVIISCLLSVLFVKQSLNFNIILLITLSYIIPYFLFL